MTDREPSTGPEDTVPTLLDPVMIAAFEGWNDAGEAASTALEHLELTWDATPLASIDPEEYYDFQVTRPHVRLAGGVPGASSGRPHGCRSRSCPAPSGTWSWSTGSSPTCAGARSARSCSGTSSTWA